MKDGLLMRSFCIATAVALMSIANNLCAGAEQNSFGLGPHGEIPHWLVLGYIPINPEKEKWAQTLDEDILKDSGGEAAIKPEGGKTLSVGGRQYTWKTTEPYAFEVIRFKTKIPAVHLFYTPEGVPAENTAAYLFCNVAAPEDLKAKFLLGSDDSVKIFLNGQLVHKFVGQRSGIEDSDALELSLKKGDNALLVRVDNYVSTGGFVGRFTDSAGIPLKALRVNIPCGPGTTALEKSASEVQWKNLMNQIPPLQPAANEASFGAHLARTISLLETSSITGRPVRIVFFGQSITAQGWTDYLVRYLREQYPEATIEAENYALGGWGMPVLNKTLVHNILSSRPDLLVFHVYSGSLEQWDRIITEIRSRTCAEIIMRSPHPQIYANKDHENGLDKNSVEMRAVAAKHACEFVECRDEWKNYMKVNGMVEKDFLIDGIHLNDKGVILMTELYARHFRRNIEAQGWDKTVRWFGARRQLEDHRSDQIMLEGNWVDAWDHAESRGNGNSLRLVFIGNRVDLVLPPGTGSAKILIDGKAPSKFNLCHGTFPELDSYGNGTPVLRRYFIGTDMPLESWTMKITEMSKNKGKFKYTLTGSVTGPDGEGDSTRDFVSKSGRIKIFANDVVGQKAPPKEEIGADPDLMVPAPEKMAITWSIVSDCRDSVQAVPIAPGNDSKNVKFTYVTVADGLPFGRHELTVLPEGTAPFGIVGVEIYCPPLGEILLNKIEK